MSPAVCEATIEASRLAWTGVSTKGATRRSPGNHSGADKARNRVSQCACIRACVLSAIVRPHEMCESRKSHKNRYNHTSCRCTGCDFKLAASRVGQRHRCPPLASAADNSHRSLAAQRIPYRHAIAARPILGVAPKPQKKSRMIAKPRRRDHDVLPSITPTPRPHNTREQAPIRPHLGKLEADKGVGDNLAMLGDRKEGVGVDLVRHNRRWDA